MQQERALEMQVRTTTPIRTRFRMTTLIRSTTLLRSQILLPIKKRKKEMKKGGAARDTAKIKRLDAEGTPAAKAEAERIRRKRLAGGANGRQRRVEKQQIGTSVGLRIEQHYMKIAELNAEAASSSQQ